MMVMTMTTMMMMVMMVMMMMMILDPKKGEHPDLSQKCPKQTFYHNKLYSEKSRGQTLGFGPERGGHPDLSQKCPKRTF